MSNWMLVHGCPGDASSWDPLENHRAIDALTLPDHGADAASATVEDHVAFVVAALERAPSPVVLVGHSYGAWVAAHAAARASSRVERLALIAGFVSVDAETAAGLEGFAQALEAGALDAETAAGIAAQRWLGANATAAQGQRIRTLFVSEGAARLARQLRRAASASAPVVRSAVDTRVIAVEGDAVVPRARCEALASALGVPVHALAGDSHFPHWSDAAAVARAIAT
jgi:pimeloyl-ACP methyl ester carboxylesterase